MYLNTESMYTNGILYSLERIPTILTINQLKTVRCITYDKSNIRNFEYFQIFHIFPFFGPKHIFLFSRFCYVRIPSYYVLPNDPCVHKR